MADDYEIRWYQFPQFFCHSPVVHEIPGLRHYLAYQTELDCDLPDWEDVANG